MSLQSTPWYEIALVLGVVLAIPTGLLAGLYLSVRSFRRAGREAEAASKE